MTTPITFSIPHQLGRAEARRRIESGFANMLSQMPAAGAQALDQRWEGDRLGFGLTLMGQSISGSVDVQDAFVTMEFVLPGVLGMMAGRLAEQAKKAAQRLLTKS